MSIKPWIMMLVVANSAFAQQDTSWSALYTRDLEGLRATIASDHPGSIDPANPQFAKTLTAEYERARAATSTVNTYDAYRFYLTRFVNSFQDEHLGAFFKRPFTNVQYAGIQIAYQNGSFVVVRADSMKYGRNLVGAVLQSCGGKAARAVFEDRVLSWRGRPGIEADWYKLAPQFFIDYGRPSPAPPTSCTFSRANERFEVPLKWATATPDELRQLNQTSTFVPRFGLERLANNSVVWVRVPSFAVNKEPELSAMRALVDSVAAVRSQPWRVLVFDLRGNSGGSSSWGDQFAGALFGEEWRAQAEKYLYDGVFTEWRVSKGNVENNRAVVAQIASRDGAESQSAKSFKTFVDSMEAALRRGQPYVGNTDSRAGVPKPVPTKVPGKVVVITGATCFSACLDFMDRFRLHPAVIHAGQITGVDTNYMENWGRPISELVSISHPMKVYRNRRRANNESYKPHVAYTGDLYDTSALQAWVLQQFAR
jgi:hypothetical protein